MTKKKTMMIMKHGTRKHHSKKFPVAWYWKLRNELRCFSEYLQESTTRCIAQLVLFFKNVPGTFFNARHQVKAIAIGVVEANTLGLTVDCSFPLHSTRIVTLNFGILCEKPTPLYPRLFSSLSSNFLNYGDHFYTSCFLFKIDHDDGTTTRAYWAI